VQWIFKATYTWDNQGGMTSQVLSGAMVYRPTPLSCQYGSMGRPSSITQGSCLYYARDLCRYRGVVFSDTSPDGKRVSESAIRTRSIPK
jgi:hypothetical protein